MAFGLFVFGVPALVLTYSRASWFAFLLGFLFIGLYIKRNRYVAIFLATFVLVIVSYLAMTEFLFDILQKHPVKRLPNVLESFSFTRWRGEYYGLGRLYWDVQTPLRVIPSAPIFGVGPGQFGGRGCCCAS